MEVNNKRKIDYRKIDRILIRSTNWIGDVILTFPAIATIRKNFPKAHIAILCKPLVAPLLEMNPDVNEVIIYKRPGHHDGILGRMRISNVLRKKRFDLAVLLQNAFDAALIAFWAGIPLRAGYNTDARGFLLTNKVILEPAVLRKHQVYYYTEMLHALGMDIIDEDPAIEVPPQLEKQATDILNSLDIQRDELLIGVSPGASFGTAKRWFPERFALLSHRISQDFGAKILLFGSAGEKHVSEIILGEGNSKIVDLTGKTSLLEAVGLIENCSLFITNDSGLMHVAAALKIPLIAIFGSTNPFTTSPIGDKSLIIRKEVSCSPCLKPDCPTDHECMKLIQVDEVYRQVKKALDNSFEKKWKKHDEKRRILG